MKIEEKIIRILNKKKKGVSLRYLKKKFGRKKIEPIIEKLADMQEIYLRDNRVYTVKKGVRIRGRIEIKKEGYGFLLREKGKDIFIPGRFLSGAMDGDYVEVEILKKRKGKRLEGRVVRILEKSKRKFVGTILKDSAGFYIFPDDPLFPPRVSILKKQKGVKLKEDLRITFIPFKGGNYGEILKILGKSDDPEVDYKVVLERFGIREEFPKKVLNFSSKLPSRINVQKRFDIRNLTLFTIDPETAKDFDDAISCEKYHDGYRLGVHIADVSFYVGIETPVFKEAYKRGNSFYLLDRAIPMLPERLSSNLCSLLPARNRYAISIFIYLDKKGRIRNHEIFESVIKSKARLNYREAQKILEGEKIRRKLPEEVIDTVKLCGEVAELLKEKRYERGSLDFDMPEPELFFDKNGKVENVRKKLNFFSHSLIEEFMILANRVVAMHLEKKGYSLIYRIHEEPDEKKLKELERVLSFLLKAKYPSKFLKHGITEIFDLQEIIQDVKGEPEEFIVQKMILRSMKQAKYSVENKGHYGLGLDKYLHFTSPIRRFPDLIIHHILRGDIKGKETFSEKELEDYAEKSSMMERVAQQAEWDIITLKSLEYLKQNMGKNLRGIISKVTPAGFYVSLLNELVDVFVPLRELKGRFKFREHSFSIESKKNSYTLGDELDLIITRVIKERRYAEGIPVNLI